MEKIKYSKLLFSILLSMMMYSCTTGNGDNDSPSNELAKGSWSMGSYVYQRGTSAQSTSKPIANGPDLRTFVITTSGTGNLGKFSGSSITGYFFEQGEGEYKVVDKNFLFANANTGKFITITCSIGTGTATGSTSYDSSNSNKYIKIRKQNNDYILSTMEEVTLTKSIDVNGGVQGAETSYKFKANEIF